MKWIAIITCLAGLAQTAAAQMGSGLVVLHPTASGALTMSGNSHVHVPAKAVYVNSNHNSQAIKTSGNAILETPHLYIRGNAQFSGNAVCTGQITVTSTLYEDPFASLSFPDGSGMPNHGNKSISGGTVVLEPGRYGSISISGQPHVTFQPGLYVINGSGLSVSGQATLVGQGVTLIIRTGSVNLSGQVTLNMSPQEQGPFSGIVLAQTPTNTSTMSMSGGSTFNMLGTIYVPKAELKMSGQGLAQGDGPHMGDLVVAQTVTLSGQGTIKIGREELLAIQLMRSPLAD